MKKSLFAILFISLLFNSAKGQDFSIRMFVTDSNSRTDTIEFGLNSSATLGIDSSFGEQDIYGQPWDSLDMRIIERDSVEHHCLMETNWWSYPLAPEIYYDYNRDFKTDYRPFTGAFGTINMSFEILIKASNPPIYITTDFSGISMNMFEGWSALHLLDSNCITTETKSIYFIELNDTIYVSNDTLTTLVAEFQHEVGVEETNMKRVKIFPNPAQTEINVISDIPTIMKLYDIFGREIKVCNESKLNIRELKKGLYILIIFDINGNQIKIEKIIKE
ncbi:MAG: T9SS type A sorting domain-containing protein [Bacteroidales bacterium]|nr:T9SS type A sorting domain-containing protein [Bacteroidales bacterium]